ncbi:DUF2306 domain-containing protein [Zavarzinia compransoris]|uniref:DUF2306 domain-containing protein n=1 Tax=Zavarzinia compransoris TaxID=1264899 RepID=A0A317E9P0_9PROT|nr:DUF2306 domain-containing protein [Zavarzinia compransoris]PWR23619.1 hypothetical protein DKG75_03370 [Zavarzinia compransoris]TDP47837.1 putative membrane protein [Zavarzinia compransoris]
MSLEPLLNASPAIQIHAFGALLAFGIGIGILFGPKGTVPHRFMGWLWVLIMTAVAISAFWVQELRIIGPFSPIHLLSILTLAGLPKLVLAARRHDVRAHRRMVYILFFGALVVAGAFTFLPGRIMSAVVTGG